MFTLSCFCVPTCNNTYLLANVITIKLRERSHSFASLSNYIARYLIDKYSVKKL